MNGPPPLKPAPIEASRRLAPLDVLRGVAVLGILYMNIQSFSMPEPAYGNPAAYGDLEGANFLVWLTGHLFFRGKFIAIFSMLFGAGIVLLADRLRPTFRRIRIYYMRNVVLVAFGVAHAYLLWFGDILYQYAITGMLLYPLRHLPARALAVLGILSLAGQVGAGVHRRSGPDWMPPAGFERAFERAMERADRGIVRYELGGYRGSWKDGFEVRRPIAKRMETDAFVFQIVWWVGGFMLLGMALYKSGFFTATLPPGVYLAWMAAGLFIGLPITAAEVWMNFDEGWYSTYVMRFGTVGVDTGSVLMSIGIAAAVMLWCQIRILFGSDTPRTDRALIGLSMYDRLAATGRMAFTNYLTQSIICTALFYGWGAGLFGYVDRIGQAFIVAAIWLMQLVWSPLWLRYFRFGPLEWIWRSLTYLRPQPLLR